MVAMVILTYFDPSGNAVMFGNSVKMGRWNNDCGRGSLGCCKIDDLEVKEILTVWILHRIKYLKATGASRLENKKCIYKLAKKLFFFATRKDHNINDKLKDWAELIMLDIAVGFEL